MLSLNSHYVGVSRTGETNLRQNLHVYKKTSHRSRTCSGILLLSIHSQQFVSPLEKSPNCRHAKSVTQNKQATRIVLFFYNEEKNLRIEQTAIRIIHHAFWVMTEDSLLANINHTHWLIRLWSMASKRTEVISVLSPGMTICTSELYNGTTFHRRSFTFC